MWAIKWPPVLRLNTWDKYSGVHPACAAKGMTLTMSCSSSEQDVQYCKKIATEWGAKTGNTLELLSIPQSSSEILGLFRQMFAAKFDQLDVMQIDVVGPGILKDQLLDLKPYTQGIEKNFFPAMGAHNTVNGKLLALPWVTDAGVMFCRKDLLAKYGEKPPATWAELTSTAKKVMDGERKAGNAAMQGFVFQARAYEGLTCTGLEWVASFGGGTIIDRAGKTTINNSQAAKALDLAASWIGTIAPTGVLNYAEEEARGVFQNGNAVFMRNWPYAWALVNGADSNIKGKVGVMVGMPKGDGPNSTGAAALGGSNGGQQILQTPQGICRSGAVHDQPGGAKRALHLPGLQPHHLGAVPGQGHPGRQPLLR